jgi:sterol desaturase/sphingolipid hydroxylase (fatty acid hydroxylase superfamily)/rhodanese-related sulfurtransferase
MKRRKLIVAGLFLGATGLVIWLLTVCLGPYERRLAPTLQKVHAEFPDLPRVTVHELAAWQSDTNRRRPLVFDVRTREEYHVSHLPGALRIDPRDTVRLLLDRLPADTPSVFYCSIGYRASLTADQLRVLGRTNVFSLEGAAFAWANAGLPLVSNGLPARVVHPYSDSYRRLLRPEARYRLSTYKSLAYEYGYLVDPAKAATATILLVVFLAWETVAPFFGWFRSRRRERTEHAVRNLTLGLLNTLVVAFLFVRLWMGVANWAEENGVGLAHWLQLEGWRRTLLTFLLLDAWTWAWHRLNHALPLLWRLHRTHHSELRVDVTSASRFHAGEIALSSLLRVPLIALLGVGIPDLLIYETVLFASTQFHHANIRLPWAVERRLRWLVVTPNLHRVHHSRDAGDFNSNFSSLLTLWDVLGGTWHWRNRPEEIAYGVTGFDAPARHTVTGMLGTPLAEEGRTGEHENPPQL